MQITMISAGKFKKKPTKDAAKQRRKERRKTKAQDENDSREKEVADREGKKSREGKAGKKQ